MRTIAVLRIPTVLGLSVFFHWFLLRTSGPWFVDGNFSLRNNHKSSRGLERSSLELEIKKEFKGESFHQSKSGSLRASEIRPQKKKSIVLLTRSSNPVRISISPPISESASTTTPDPSQTTPVIYSPAPQYPEVALQRHLEGRVLIKIETNGEGVVNSWILEQSTGHEVLDEAALSAVKEWRLAPRSAYLIPFTFKIK